MTPQEIIDVIAAYRDGKQIEMRRQDESSDWCWIAAPAWNFSLWDYRVKQPAALRPHWPAIVRMPYGPHVVGTQLYTMDDPELTKIIGFVRLATEYPPVMLP